MATRTMAALAGFMAIAACEARAERIRDNLFLLEEAYNQEPGVVQHIQVMQLDPAKGGWSYSFTGEWPIPDDRHQLSLTVPQSRVEGAAPRLCDVLVNYRLQALGMGGRGRVAVAPRLSLVLPTGEPGEAGRGVVGTQLAVPVSIELGPLLVVHLNASLTFAPGAHDASGPMYTALDTGLGAALVFEPLDWFNVVVEAGHTTTTTASGRDGLLFVNPGVRFALNLGPDVQIVPGVSAPVLKGPDGVRVAALAYLSVEHVMWR